MAGTCWWVICLTHLTMSGTFIGFHYMVRYTTTFECYVIRVILGWLDYLFTSCIAPCIIASFTDPIMLLKVAWINVIKGQWLLTNSTSVWHIHLLDVTNNYCCYSWTNDNCYNWIYHVIVMEMRSNQTCYEFNCQGNANECTVWYIHTSYNSLWLYIRVGTT